MKIPPEKRRNRVARFITKNMCKNPKELPFIDRLSFMGGISKYFKGEWSYAQFRIQGERAVCGFSEDGSHLITVTYDGLYYIAEIP